MRARCIKYDIVQLGEYKNDYESWLINKNNIYMPRYLNNYVYLFIFFFIRNYY